MKKVFISCPVKGRTEENIKKSIEKMHKIAEIIFEQELEIITAYQGGLAEGVYHASTWCLGKSIQKLSDADYYVGLIGWYDSGIFADCTIEREIAQKHGIRNIVLDPDDVMPDAVEFERSNYRVCDNCEPEACDRTVTGVEDIR